MARWPFRRTLSPGSTRRDREAEIREELELYLELRTEELMREGMSAGEARREAEARFGDPAEIERRLRRDARRRGMKRRTGQMIGNLAQDVAYTFRSFRRSPGFAAVAVLTLGLALAGNTAIFSVLDAAVLRALPFPEADRLVFVRGYHLQGGERAFRLASVPEFRDWRARARSIDPMVAVDFNTVTLADDEGAERLPAEVVSEGYFRMLGGATAVGRTFTDDEYRIPDGHPVVVIGHALWTRRFGGDPAVLGRTVSVNERSLTVVGVMEEGFEGVALGVDLWMPLGMISVVASADRLDERGSRFLNVTGRLAPGTSVASAQAELDRIARELQAEHPESQEDRFAEVQPLREGYLGSTGGLLWTLAGAGILLLLIAAANVANLLLVRARARTRELAVRRALGAAGTRVARQLVTESLVLAVVGGGVGLLLAGWALEALVPQIPFGVLPAYATPELSARAFLFTLAVLSFVGIAAGMVPAAATARGDLTAGLRDAGRGVAGARARAHQLFVVTQVALALLLLAGAGLLARSVVAQLAVDPGVELEGIHVFRVQPPRERYPDRASLRLFTAEVLRRVEAVPGVRDVTASSDFPFRGRSSGSYIVRPDEPETLIRYHHHSVAPGYFENLGIDLLAGRTFTPADDEDASGVAVVTEALTRRVFPDDPSPVGRTIYLGPPDDPDNAAEIVGVVEDVRYRNLTQDMMAEPNSPDVFFSIRQIPTRTQEISYRVDGDPATALQGIRAALRAFDPAVPLFQPTTLRQAYRAQTATPRLAAWLMGVFSAFALLLACVGLYGVLAFTVGQRSREIAVRLALGAAAGDVARAVVMDGMRLTLGGLAIGVVAAILAGRLLEGFLFGVEASDPATLGGVALVMLAVGLTATVVPAWRATRRRPVEVLAGE